MPLEVTLQLGDGNSLKEEVTAVFDDEDRRRFHAYLTHLEELFATRIGREGMNPRLNVTWEEGNAMNFNAELPPADDLLAYLHRLRPFLLQDEFAPFEKIVGILGRRIDSKQARNFCKGQMKLYKGEVLKSAIKITVSDLIVNSEKTLMDWLNSHEYHRDQEKRKKLKGVFEVMTDDGAKAIFVMLIVDKANAIKNIGRVVNFITSSSQGGSLYFGPPNNRHDWP